MNGERLTVKKAAIVSCFGWYDKRLYFLYDKLEDSNYIVKYYTSDYTHGGKGRREELDDRFTYIHVPTYKKNISFRRFYSHYIFAKKTSIELNKEKPDLVYVLTPPNMVAKIAAQYKKKNPNTKLVIDIIDMWPESFPNTLIRKTPIYSIWKGFRNKSLIIADKIVLECDYYRECIDGVLIDKCSTVRLQKKCSYSDIDDSRAVIDSLKNSIPSKRISLCYLGNANNIIDLESIQRIFSALKSEGYSVILHFIGRGSSKQALLDIANENCSEVYDYGVIYDEHEKRRVMNMCDFGINMMKSTVEVGLTLKSIDYLSCGLPLLNNIKGDTWDLIIKNKIGLNYQGDSQGLIRDINACASYELKNNALNCYQEMFSPEAFENNFSNVIADVLN